MSKPGGGQHLHVLSRTQQNLMDPFQLAVLSLCWWAVSARPTWSNKPFFILSSIDIMEGETVTVTCGVPIDYGGGDCRLFRGHRSELFRVQRESGYRCVFTLTSQELLGRRPAGTRVPLRCDYKIQQYVTESSDQKDVIIWAKTKKPSLSVSRHFLSVDESVEVTCVPPRSHVYSCHFYRDDRHIAYGPCSQNLTGSVLTMFEKPVLLLPVRLTCGYRLDEHLYVRSEASEPELLFAVDARGVSSSVNCTVSVDDKQLATLTDSSWTFVHVDRPTVTVQATNNSVLINETCQYAETHSKTISGTQLNI